MKKYFILLFVGIQLLSFQMNAQEKGAFRPKNDLLNQLDPGGNKYGIWSEKEGDITWKGEYVANTKVKNWVGYYPNNYISKLEYYSNGLKDGILMQFDRKGKVTLIENYRDDKLHGQVINYGQYSETPQSETTYANGKKNGLFRQYYDNGKIQEDTWFKDDKKDGLSRWNNKAGQKIAEYNYAMGEFAGTQKTFYENDTLQTINNYLNNTLSGDSKEYYRNGKVKLAGKYVAGKKEGAWTEYDEIGKVTRVVKYLNDLEIKK